MHTTLFAIKMLVIYPFTKLIKEERLFGDLERTGKSLQLKDGPSEDRFKIRNSHYSN